MEIRLTWPSEHKAKDTIVEARSGLQLTPSPRVPQGRGYLREPQETGRNGTNTKLAKPKPRDAGVDTRALRHSADRSSPTKTHSVGHNQVHLAHARRSRFTQRGYLQFMSGSHDYCRSPYADSRIGLVPFISIGHGVQQHVITSSRSLRLCLAYAFQAGRRMEKGVVHALDGVHC